MLMRSPELHTRVGWETATTAAGPGSARACSSVSPAGSAPVDARSDVFICGGFERLLHVWLAVSESPVRVLTMMVVVG